MNPEDTFKLTNNLIVYVGDKQIDTYVIVKCGGNIIKFNYDDWLHLKIAMNDLNAEVSKRFRYTYSNF